MDCWASIIDKEYKLLKAQKEKETIQLWNINKAAVYSQTKEKYCTDWKTKSDKCLQLQDGAFKANKSCSSGKQQRKSNKENAIILPAAYAAPKMTMWVPIPQNFVSKDSEKLESIPYIGENMLDNSFVEDLISSYDMPETKTECIDDEMFVKLVRNMIPYQSYVTSTLPLRSSAQVNRGYQNINQKVKKELPDEDVSRSQVNGGHHNINRTFIEEPDEAIFRSISSYFNGNYSADRYTTLTSKSCTPNIDEPMAATPADFHPDPNLSSYRKYFCRRCCIYNCQLHSDSEEKSSILKSNVQELKPFTEPCSTTCYMNMNTCNIKTEDIQDTIAETVSVPRNTPEASKETLDEMFTLYYLEDSDESSFAEILTPSTAESDRTFSEMFTNFDGPKVPPNAFPYMFTQASTSKSENSCTERFSQHAPVTESIMPGAATPADEATTSENEWTSENESMFLSLLRVFPYNCCAIAKTMLKSCEQVHKKMRTTDVSARCRVAAIDNKPCKKEQNKTKTYADANQHLTKTYSPCNHEGPCRENSNCLCSNCEKFCRCGSECKKRVRKCNCKRGSCMTSQCICYYGQRECDPETCECSSCKNTGIQRGQGKSLQTVESRIHGWGVAVKEDCRKFDFISEYKGEIISLKECDRRGRLYDKIRCTYMFTLNGDSVIDAMNFGSKIRFANFSKEPNCYCRVMMVNGDHRIGVYAARRITAGEELTIDYCTYDPTVSD